jgi:hypothetical protein
MSTGHDHPDWQSADTTKLKRIMENPRIEQWRWRYRPIKREHDLPYLGGYSRDGNTLYIDRHLPDTLEIEDDGTKWVIDPCEFIRLHEEMEKGLLETLGWHYGNAHALANAAERRAVLERGIPWLAYNQALAPFIKADETERLETVPADLDMTPYLFPPVDRALISRMRKAMGEEKLEKTDPKVSYSDDSGRPNHHCGPDSDWPTGYCKFYDGQHSCSKVEGYIAAHGGCKLWKAANEPD